MKSCKRYNPKHINTRFNQFFKSNDKHRSEITSCVSQYFLSINIHDFEIQNVSFNEINENKVINGTFSNVIYTDSNIIFNGIFILLPNIHSYISKLVSIENMVINSYREFCFLNKSPKYVINEYFKDNESLHFVGNDYIFKISGIWETETHYGINYKFVKRTQK